MLGRLGRAGRRLPLQRINKSTTWGSATVTTDTVGTGLSPPPSIYTDDHLEMQKSLRRIIDDDINPHVDDWERAGQAPIREIFKKLGSAGFLCPTREPEYGGAGLDFTHQIAISEELGNIQCGSVPMAIQVQDMATPALAKHGSDELKREFLAPSIAGDFVACLGVSEVQAGSDVANVTTTAIKDGDDYVINGGKMWTTNGKSAHWMCVLANTATAEQTGSPYNNKTLICLPMDTPGVSTSEKLDKLGMRSSDTCQVFFDDVRVPQANRIGKEGQGFVYQMQQFQEERMIISATMVRQLESVVEECARYTADRHIFGRPVLVRREEWNEANGHHHQQQQQHQHKASQAVCGVPRLRLARRLVLLSLTRTLADEWCNCCVALLLPRSPTHPSVFCRPTKLSSSAWQSYRRRWKRCVRSSIARQNCTSIHFIGLEFWSMPPTSKASLLPCITCRRPPPPPLLPSMKAPPPLSLHHHHRTAPHSTAQHRTAPHRTAQHSTAPHRTPYVCSQLNFAAALHFICDRMLSPWTGTTKVST